MKTKVD